MLDIYGTGGWHLPASWLAALATSDLRRMVYGTESFHGIVRFLHLLSMAMFFGVVAVGDIRRAGFFIEASLQTARPLMLPLMNISFLIALLSGVVLFLYDPLGIGLHTMFLPKLILIVIGYVHAHVIQRLAFVRDRQMLRRAAAMFGLLVWILVIACSTWNHIERPLNPADIHRMDTY